MFSHKELNGKSTNQMQEMMFENGTNWNDFDGKLKRGRVIMKVQDGERTKWASVEPPTFTADFGFIRQMLPENL